MPLFTAVAALFFAQIDQSPTADQLLQSLLDQRLALRSGQLHFTVENIETHFVFEYEYTFDGENRRMDVTYPPGSFNSAGSSAPSTFSRVVKYVVTDEEFLYHIVELRENPETYVATKVSMDEWRGNVRDDPRYEYTHSMHKQAFDPRIIGVATQQVGAWWRIGLSDLLESQTLRTGAVRSDRLNDESVWVIDAHYESGIDTRLWFSPEKGGSIVASRVEMDDNGTPFADVMSAKVAEYPAGNDQVWFPSEVHSYRELPDGRTSESLLRIESAEFNLEIPEETFTLAGFDLPIGTHVAVPRSEYVRLSEKSGAVQRQKKWDGTQLVPLEPSDMPQHTAPFPRKN